MLRLSSSGQRHVAAATQALLSPLDHAEVDSWRKRVNRSLKEALGADMATFLLPVESRRLVYSEEVEIETAREYPNLMPRLPKPVSIWQRQVELRVWSRASVYGSLLPDYYRSEYYNDFIVPGRGYDSIGLTIPLANPIHPASLAGLIFHHDRPNGPRFGARGLSLLRLIEPAFAAGVHTHLRFAKHRENLARMVDDLGQALLITDFTGKAIHRTPALDSLLVEDPEGERLIAEMDRLAARVSRTGPSGSLLAGADGAASTEIRTQGAHYRLRASQMAADLLCPGGSVLVALERLTPRLPPDDRLRERFGLTRAEARVARLLADGKSNAAVAAALSISPHTAERHTEKVLLKMGLHSRAGVARRVLSDGASG